MKYEYGQHYFIMKIKDESCKNYNACGMLLKIFGEKHSSWNLGMHISLFYVFVVC